MCVGIVEELRGIDWGDKRLNRRSALVLEALAANPEASVNAAGDGWSDTLAAYRLFNNDSVTPELILQPHREATQRRMREHSVVLIVQDTTELDDTKHPTDDAQCLNTERRFGLYEHVHLAVTPDKLCLGVVGSEFFGRAPESLGKADERRTRPIEEKASFRWLKGYRLACELAAECRGCCSPPDRSRRSTRSCASSTITSHAGRWRSTSARSKPAAVWKTSNGKPITG